MKTESIVADAGAEAGQSALLASAAFSLGVRVFTQIIWQEKAVTAPP